ncbi:hypothetical protein RHSIM_Rhsim03G0075400 [Rhododendron simsii]|uniref:SKI-interacting protein SKIP SNW domain-containing protein n=1 Tax=Rhododendron simsii TaxID=118357 RepID=A0A834LVH0_RHOSS|nr:hypothetical protein RHSIM_Rhsim03G0075400 [Rhododendron simsii]
MAVIPFKELEEEEESEETTRTTRAELEKSLNRRRMRRLGAAAAHSKKSIFIKYKPSRQYPAAAFNSGADERIIRIFEMPADSLEPPKFKHKKRVPSAASGSPPEPVMHSPPRPVTVKDQQDWKIPPCASNWKNPKGHTIPLDKRELGRGLQDEVRINENFAKLSEALYVTEQKSREAVAMRLDVQKQMMMKAKERKDQELRSLAQKARCERSTIHGAGDGMSDGEREERLQREAIREEWRREWERETRFEGKDASAMGKKRKITTRGKDRDIGDKVALGTACTGAGGGTEVMYDQRLFNLEKGTNSGVFATEDQYNVYDKGMFTTTAQLTLPTLFKTRKDTDADMFGGADEQLDKIMKTDRFKPDKAFTGTSEKTGARDSKAIELKEEADPFGLDQFLKDVIKGKKGHE